jgi:hypothetical protein
MATGTLGQADLSALTNTTVYTVPADTTATVNINLCNRSGLPRSVRIAICASGTPANAEYIEYDAYLTSGGTLERTGLVISANKLVVVYSTDDNVSVNVYGYEA